MNNSTIASPSANSQTTTLGRIVANVVDVQQQQQQQFHNIQATLEALRLEQRTIAQNLREDLRRTDDRAQKQVDELRMQNAKQVDELRMQHAKEIERLTEIIKLLIAKEATAVKVEQPPQPRLPQQSYQAGQPAASFFGPLPSSTSDMQLRQAYYMQHEQQLRQMMHQQQQQMAASPMPTPGGITTGAPISPGLATKPTIPATQQQQQPSSAAQVQLLTPPKPSAGTVNLPFTPPIETPKPKAEIKDVVLPASTPVAPTSSGLFGKPASPATATPKPLFGQQTGGSIFGTPKVLEKKEEPPKEPTPIKKEEHDDEEHVEEYEPQVDFKPVVPLPELVDVKTGEEDEEVLFEERCKLFRYVADTKEWKERGLGNIKILKDPKSGAHRVVMRREQVHKLCANFKLTKDMSISKMGKNEKACIWHCFDFAEGEQTHEQLSAKFASVETAQEFMKIFSEGTAGTVTPTKSAAAPKEDEKMKAAGFGEQFKKKEGEWDCPDCYTRNKAESSACACCGTNKDGSKSDANIFAKPVAQANDGKPKFSFGIQTAGDATVPKFSFGIPAASKETPKEAAPTVTSTTKEAEKPKFSFSAAAAAAAKEETPVNTPQKTGLFGASAAPKFSFGGASPSTSIFGGAKPTDGKPAAATSFSFVKKDETPSTSSPVSFSFKAPTSPAVATPGKSLFGQSAEKPTEGSATPTTTTSRIFGSGLTGCASGNAFADAAKSPASIFNDEARKKAEAQFANQKKSVFGAPAKKEEKENDDEDHEGDEEYEPQVDFAPVVPLPDLVEVKTGEEGEEVVFKHRARLYRFDRANKEWKERGTGDIKILKNPITGKCRVVMRREQVHKLCANFAIIPAIELNQKPGVPNVFNWICKDFAEATEGSDEMFSLKFKTEEIGVEFREAFTKAQRE